MAGLSSRPAKDTDMIQWATEIKVRAERQAGVMLAQSAQSGDRHQHGRVSPDAHKPTTLGDLGISANQSSRWQSLASMTDEHFEAAVATAKDTAVPTVSGLFHARNLIKILNQYSGTMPFKHPHLSHPVSHPKEFSNE